MTKKELVDKIVGLLKADFDLSFLLKLEKAEIETLVAAVRASEDKQEG